jgi:hypothetical protein
VSFQQPLTSQLYLLYHLNILEHILHFQSLNRAFNHFPLVMGFELRASCLLGKCSTIWASLPVLFSVGYFWDSVFWTIKPGWLQTEILRISASRVARITGAWPFFIKATANKILPFYLSQVCTPLASVIFSVAQPLLSSSKILIPNTNSVPIKIATHHCHLPLALGNFWSAFWIYECAYSSKWNHATFILLCLA